MIDLAVLVVIITSIATPVTVICGLIIRYSFASKCIKVKCCGCIECDRDIKNEHDPVQQHGESQVINNTN